MPALLAETVVADFRILHTRCAVEEIVASATVDRESRHDGHGETSLSLRPEVRSLQRWLDLNA
jgi:hypothetical protein